jgi:hypothetical protein
MKPTLFLTVLVLAASGLGGCDQSAVGFVVHEVAAVFTPPEKTKPALTLEGQDVLLVVDVARRDLATDQPRLTLLVAQSLAREMNAHQAARNITDPNELAAYARSRPVDYQQFSLVELGRRFKATRVVHIVLEDYRLAPAPGDTFSASAAVTIRVIDVDKGVQILPEFEGETELDVHSAAGIAATSRQGAEKVLLDGLALKISQLFVSYEVDKLPLHPEIQ